MSDIVILDGARTAIGEFGGALAGRSLIDHGVPVVHGHTPVDIVSHYGNRLNIDTGAGYGKPMSAVVIEGCQIWHLTPQGRVEITV